MAPQVEFQADPLGFLVHFTVHPLHTADMGESTEERGEWHLHESIRLGARIGEAIMYQI